jgi:hypothetical protein
MNKRTLGILGTLIVHLVIPVYFLWPPTMVPPPPPVPPDKGTIEVKLIPMSAVEEEKKKGPEPGIDGSPDPRICAQVDSTYVGIGIIHSFSTQVVTSAPAGYPGYDAGIRVGDILITLEDDRANTKYVQVHIKRGDKQLWFRIKKDKICFNNLKQPG